VNRISASVRKKAKKIKLLLLDVDGVLTDGKIILDDRGVETKQFHVRDGQGIAMLMRAESRSVSLPAALRKSSATAPRSWGCGSSDKECKTS
jgi:3-deoxy-D-manno-octulosonate 8-phosphate phosphatase KdsC-like HAD superfamily phosphatase